MTGSKAVEQSIEQLKTLGFTEYEAKVYLALVADHPATAYAISQVSGVPHSRVYDITRRLISRGAALQIGSNPDRFSPLPPEELTVKLERDHQQSVNEFRELIKTVPFEADFDPVWNIADREEALRITGELIEASGRTVYIGIWDDELGSLLPALRAADARGVRVVFLIYGSTDPGFGELYYHRTEGMPQVGELGRTIDCVVDSAACVSGCLGGSEPPQVVWTKNRGLVKTVEEYIIHDFYLAELQRSMGDAIAIAFGRNLEKLREKFGSGGTQQVEQQQRSPIRYELRETDQLLTWAEVDLDALASNLKSLKAHITPGTKIMAVVKSNGYGHGAVMSGKTALDAGAERLAVHRVEEGIELREAGIEAPILLMGYAPVATVPLIVDYRLTPTVTTLEFAKRLNGYASERDGRDGGRIPVHIKVDTGMSRHGLFPEEVPDFIRNLQKLSSITVEGIFSHFATADEANDSFAREQLSRFQVLGDKLTAEGICPPLTHMCNSAAALRFPDAHFNAVRPGVALYGMAPSGEFTLPFPLQPVLSLKSRVVRIKTLPQGSCIGYGCTHFTEEEKTVALVPVGYGDGYHRIISNRGAVIVGGRRAAVLGRVSMDQITVDVTGIPGIALEDEVTLFGRTANTTGGPAADITADEVASWSETINYEITTSLSPRVARVYKRGGKIVSVQTLTG
jgi:alanine racemase